MRTILLAMLCAMAIGLLGTSGSSAVPANGAAIGQAVAAEFEALPVHYRRRDRYGPYCFSKCYKDFFTGRRVCRKFC